MRLTKLSSFYIPHFMLHIVQTNNCCHNVIGWQISEIPTFRILKKLKVFFFLLQLETHFLSSLCESLLKGGNSNSIELEIPAAANTLRNSNSIELEIPAAANTLHLRNMRKKWKVKKKNTCCSITLHPDKLRETLGWTFISVSSQIPNRAITKIYKYIRHSSTLVQL